MLSWPDFLSQLRTAKVVSLDWSDEANEDEC